MFDTIRAVHQFVPTYAGRDAIGGHVRQIRRLLHEHGLASEIYTTHAHPDVRDEAQLARRYRSTDVDGTVLLYHSSIGSELADEVASHPERLVVDYHNVTPVEFFAPWEPHVAHALAWGRRQLTELASRAAAGIADSAHNAAEMRAAGFRSVSVVPILLDTDAFDHAVDQSRLEALKANTTGGRWLFVGRIAPNKCQHDLVKALAVYRRVYDPDARLDLVGGPSSHAYQRALEQFIDAAGMADAVTLWGSVDDGTLAALYAAADVFVCVSEHEGFCVPLLEAMSHRTPIVAYASTAVPETLGRGGVVLDDKSPAVVAAAVDRLRRDPGLASVITAAGAARLADFSLERSRTRMIEALGALDRAS